MGLLYARHHLGLWDTTGTNAGQIPALVELGSAEGRQQPSKPIDFYYIIRERYSVCFFVVFCFKPKQRSGGSGGDGWVVSEDLPGGAPRVGI